MISEKNFLLVGNSRLHWAIYSQNQYKFSHTKKDSKIPQNIDFHNLIWGSVGKSPDLLLEKENEIKTEDIKLSNLPNYFGVDRALGALCALNTIKNPLKKNLLIADFGTILSITKLSADGSIIGGLLSPGFLTQLSSMEMNTKNLKVPAEYRIPPEEFLLNTEDAIIKGVMNSLIGLISSSFKPLEDILIICGGDSELITKILKTNNVNVINAPNLVMEGMIIHNQLKKNYCNPKSAIM